MEQRIWTGGFEVAVKDVNATVDFYHSDYSEHLVNSTRYVGRPC